MKSENRTIRRTALAFSVLIATCTSPVTAAPSFEREVYPILRRHCIGCHSALDKKAKGGLSLDAQAEFVRGGDTGAVIVAGKPDESLLVKMIIGEKPEMPKKAAPLSPDNVKIIREWIAAGGAIDAWPSADKVDIVIPREYRFAPAVTSVALSPDGQRVAAACRSEVVVLAVEGDSTPLRLPTECDLVTHVEFSPDGTVLAVSGGSPGRYGEVRFFSVPDFKLIRARRVSRDTLFRGNFAPDSKAIALGGADGAAHIVPLDAQAAVTSIELHSDWVMDVAYSHDGAMLVTGGRDKATKIASVASRILLRGADLGSDHVTAVASDEKFALSVNRRGELMSYDYKIALSGVEVSGSGNGAQPITKRDQYARGLESQGGETFDLTVSGDRKLLATAGAFGEVRVYRIADRQRVATIGKVPAPVYCASLDMTGARLAVGSRSGVVQIYELTVPATGAATVAPKLLHSLTPVPVQARLP